MHLRRFVRYILRYRRRKRIDWTLKKGELVVSDGWRQPAEIVDINWALWAAAVRLGPQTIVVWPLWGLRRYAS